MRRGVRGHIVLVAMALAVLVLPASATANPRAFPLPASPGIPPQLLAALRDRGEGARARRSFTPQLELKSRDGYEIGVIGVNGSVAIEVAREHGFSETAYLARGTATPTRLQASFGPYGRISVRFHPSKNRSGTRHCSRRGRFVVRRGTYVGVIRFTGEDGYVSVDAHRARGAVRIAAPKCRRHHPPRPSHAPGPSRHASTSGGEIPSFFGFDASFLAASWRQATSSALFLAVSEDDEKAFLTIAEQTEGQIAKLRFAFSRASTGFSLNDALTAASVSPPPPFEGTGTYTAAPDGTTSWTGTLAVNFPGAPHFPLTGAPFEAEVGAGL